jgi:hypothetical protein
LTASRYRSDPPRRGLDLVCLRRYAMPTCRPGLFVFLFLLLFLFVFVAVAAFVFVFLFVFLFVAAVVVVVIVAVDLDLDLALALALGPESTFVMAVLGHWVHRIRQCRHRRARFLVRAILSSGCSK